MAGFGAGNVGTSQYLESQREEKRKAALNPVIIQLDQWLNNQEKAFVSSATDVIDEWVNQHNMYCDCHILIFKFWSKHKLVSGMRYTISENSQMILKMDDSIWA